MSKEKAPTMASVFLQEFTSAALYKRSQGRLARQITCVVIWLVVAIGCWRMSAQLLGRFDYPVKWGVPGLLLLVGMWFGYRIVNYPPFADFLIAVEAEMNKVSWPTWRELSRSTVVVIVLIVGLTAVLFSLDTIFVFLLETLGVARG